MNERSKKYYDVESYYEIGLLSKKRVKNAVGRWITKEEYELITGESYL